MRVGAGKEPYLESADSITATKASNKISAAASTTANNVGALTDLYGSFLGKPVIKVASAFYALKATGQSFLAQNANKTAQRGE